MDISKKQEFVRRAGKKKLSPPSIVHKKLDFVHSMTKTGLEHVKHFDSGGIADNSTGDASLSSGTSNNSTGGNGAEGLMSNIAGGLGLNDNFQGAAANIQQGTNAGQLSNAYTGTQNALNAQIGLANTLNPQASTAVNNQNQVASEEAAEAQGAGPNPAQNQLAQATGANVANQAALAAGQRGSSGNVGMMERQAAQTGANAEQQAAGQAATLGSQQQLAAQNNLANLSNNQISQAGQATTNLNSAQQNEQATLENANTAANNAAVGMQSNINNVNSQTAAANQNMAGNVMGGVLSGASSALSSIGSLFSKGGEVKPNIHGHKKLDFVHKMTKMALQHFDDGGDVDSPNEGSFKASDASASSPDIPGTSTLPADTANFGQDMSGGGGKSGGGGGGGLMALAAMADGGMIQQNPLIQAIQGNAANLGSGKYNSGSVSGGPSIPGTSSLAAPTSSFSKAIQDGKKNQPSSTDQTQNKINQQNLSDSPTLQMPDFGTGNVAQQTPAQMDASDMSMPDIGSESAPSSPDYGLGGDTSFSKGGQIHRLHPAEQQAHFSNHFVNYFSGGSSKKVPAMVSPGERYLSPQDVHKVVNEGANPMKLGVKIPGKAKVKNDSLKNDTVPAKLEVGGMVIPRHITEHKMAPDKAALFVHRALARKRSGK